MLLRSPNSLIHLGVRNKIIPLILILMQKLLFHISEFIQMLWNLLHATFVPSYEVISTASSTGA